MEDTIVNTVMSENTLLYGRTLNTARMHHFVIDGTRDPREEITPVETFASSVSACCVQWVEQLAREGGVELTRITAEITATRTVAEPNRFQVWQIDVRAVGPKQAQLETFVEGFKARCPLYRTVAAATEVRFTVRAEGAASEDVGE
ncbi:MAG TPA: OsmC family protein [Chloroflexota bacterium]|jgi:uncharacterized OsmC-like protein|nr:OsmC family protein [Chloroflexota bacterium]